MQNPPGRDRKRQGQQAKCKDPRISADNIPMDTTMINQLASLPNFKSITSKHKETIIKLFLSLQWAHNAAAKTTGYLASLVHVLNTNQFFYLLKHSMRPLVQLQIPQWLCHPGKRCFTKPNLLTNKMYEQKAVNVILPRPHHPKLDSIEPKHAMRALAAAVYYTLRQQLFDKFHESQAGVANLFLVEQKKF